MAGAAFEAASRGIGQQLALLGVPAPADLEGKKPAQPDELKNFFMATGMLEQESTDVAKALFDELTIQSITVFGWWFADNDLKEWFQSHQAWKKNATLSYL